MKSYAGQVQPELCFGNPLLVQDGALGQDVEVETGMCKLAALKP